jgi:hypothetical protein
MTNSPSATQCWPSSQLRPSQGFLSLRDLGPPTRTPAPRGFAAPVANCGGRMKLRALLRDRDSIERFLRHQALASPSALPTLAHRPTSAASHASSLPLKSATRPKWSLAHTPLIGSRIPWISTDRLSAHAPYRCHRFSVRTRKILGALSEFTLSSSVFASDYSSLSRLSCHPLSTFLGIGEDRFLVRKVQSQ